MGALRRPRDGLARREPNLSPPPRVRLVLTRGGAAIRPRLVLPLRRSAALWGLGPRQVLTPRAPGAMGRGLQLTSPAPHALAGPGPRWPGSYGSPVGPRPPASYGSPWIAPPKDVALHALAWGTPRGRRAASYGRGPGRRAAARYPVATAPLGPVNGPPPRPEEGYAAVCYFVGPALLAILGTYLRDRLITDIARARAYIDMYSAPRRPMHAWAPPRPCGRTAHARLSALARGDGRGARAQLL